MAPPGSKEKGFTVTEVLVAVVVFFVLFVLLGLYVSRNSLIRSSKFSFINSLRQIHIATMSMANDGAANKDISLGWPGDLKANGRIKTLGDFVTLLVKNEYLKAGDLHIFSAINIKPYRGELCGDVLVPAFDGKYSGAKVYLVRDGDAGDTLFLASKNYTYNTPLTDPSAKPFGDKGFVACQKGGNCFQFKKQQTQDLQTIGQLPGGGTVESAENCLNP